VIEAFRTAVRQAVVDTLKPARITAVHALNDYSVQVSGHVDHRGHEVPMRLHSMANVAHVVGEQVYILWENPKDRKCPPMWVILDATTRLASPSKLFTRWPRRRYDQARTGRVDPLAAVPAALRVVEAANSHPTQLVRSLQVAIVQAGGGGVWVISGASEATRAAEWGQLLAHDGNLFAIEEGHLKLFSAAAIGTAVATSELGDIEHEAVLISGAVVVMDSSDHTSWQVASLNASTLVGSASSMAWDGWVTPRGIAHSAVGGPYPIVTVTEPLYAHEASASPRIQPIVIGGAIIPPADDSTFRQAMQDRRADPMAYEADEWLWLGHERPQLQVVVPASGARLWQVDGTTHSAFSEGNASLTPVLADGDRVIAHWERSDWAEVTFCHYLANPEMIPPFGTWIQDYIDAHIEFKWEYAGLGGRPWADTAPAPRWAWDPDYTLAALIGPLVADLEPAFSEPITRDYQANVTHGMCSIQAGAVTAIVELGDEDPDSPLVTTTDNGDPMCNAHRFEEDPLLPPAYAPRTMVTGEAGYGTVTLTPEETEGYSDLLDYLRRTDVLTALDEIPDYVATEQFLGALWTTDVGGSTNLFWQGHIWYGGSVDENGISSISGRPPFVYLDNPDTENDGRWAHTTQSVTYHYHWITAQPVETHYRDRKYGADPFNALPSENLLLLLPRTPMRPVPRLMKRYWPLTDPTGQEHIGYTLDAQGRYVGGAQGVSRKPHYGQYLDIDPTGYYKGYVEFDRSLVLPSFGAWDTKLPTRWEADVPTGDFYVPDGVDLHTEYGYAVEVQPPGSLPIGTVGVITSPTGYWPGVPVQRFWIPMCGYWYDGGDPMDDASWTPVDFRRLETGFRGIKGDVPRGGSYLPDAHVTSPQIPRYGDGLSADLVALDRTSLEEQWRHSFGRDVNLSAPPDAFVHEDRLYLAMLAPRVMWLLLDGVPYGGTAGEITYHLTRGFTSLAGRTAPMSDYGRARIEYLIALPAEPAETWWDRFMAEYPGGTSNGVPNDVFLPDGTIRWPIVWEWLRNAAYLHDGRGPVSAIAPGTLWVPSQWTAPAQVTVHNLTDGSVIESISVDVAAGATGLELVLVDGRVVLGTSSGRYDITG